MPTKNKFKPVKPIVYVTKERTTILDRKNININTIGEKGFGLSCIPLQWTLPFIVVSAQLVDEYKNLIAKNQKTDDWLHEWCTRIGTALVKENITGDIIVRSSGCAEGLAQRGDLCSCSGTSTDIFNLLLQCLQDLYSKNNIIHKNIPLVIQQYIKGSIYRGHLSNERRVSAQKRDWTGQIDEYNYIKIHHREWRRSFDINKLSKQSITCSNVKNIKKALEIPATWAAKK